MEVLSKDEERDYFMWYAIENRGNSQSNGPGTLENLPKSLVVILVLRMC